jgi:DNA helicase-4
VGNELLVILIIGIFIIVGYSKFRRASYFKSEKYRYIIGGIYSFLSEIDSLRKEYFTNSAKLKMLSKYEEYRQQVNKGFIYKKSDADNIMEFINIYDHLNDKVKDWNQAYIKSELNQNLDFFNDIDGRALDDEQRLAIVVDEDNNLVIAGAGSGKTLTISGKVKYLVDRKSIKSDEILLLSFTRKAAEEMQQRITNRLKINVEAKTFHKLGLEIIAQAKGYRPDINSDTEKFVEDFFKKEILKDRDTVENVVKFFSYYINIPKDLDQVEVLGEAHDYYKDVDLETIRSKVERLKRDKSTIKGEKVKSFEEVVIANYLFLNGINYIYEMEYPYPQEDKYRKKYRPDFYLPDYDIYIEHFGVSRNNNAPWLSEIEERKYIEGMQWKRKLHESNHTHLIETYSFLFSEGTLFSVFEKALASAGVLLSPINIDEIYRKLFIENKDSHFRELEKLTHTFIGLFKSRGFKVVQFDNMLADANKIENDFFRERTKVFLSFMKPLFVYYQGQLEQSEQIDFNDMINMASEFIEQGAVKLNYKYIIIDEYQDMSVSRFKLIKAIRDNTGAKIMSVGDDWQSIYRFTGSDIDLFVNFEKYFGYTELLKIQKTYRNSQELIDIAGRFIMDNPKQIKKQLISDTHVDNPLRIFGYGGDFVQAFLSVIEQIVEDGKKADAEVMLIGRTNYDIKVFQKDEENRNENNKLLDDIKIVHKDNEIRLVYKKYPKLRLNFLTAHRSKGLEADYVIIINMKNTLLGFPNKIADDPLLGLVLTDLDPFSFSEERRLFYVAMTRTKKVTYLLVPQLNMSIFADELIKTQKIAYELKTDEQEILNNPNCPRCTTGHLVLRENSNDRSKFLGCSNYPLCDNTFKNVEILNSRIVCEKCGGYMVKRNGRNGEFYGCTNFPVCENTYEIQRI